MSPPEVHAFLLRQIARGPDEIRGQVGSLAFIYTRYPDPGGNRWFVRPGYVGHEEMTNTHGMLRAFFGPKSGEVAGQVVTITKVYAKDGRGHHAPTGETNEVWDWYEIRRLAKQENLFGRAGTLGGRQVVMLWGDPPGWEGMLVEVLGRLGLGSEGEAVVTVANDRQFMARDFTAGVLRRGGGEDPPFDR